MNQCKNCEWWIEDNRGKEYSGDCRRYPPNKGIEGDWPQVSQNDFCGEFAPKVEPVPETHPILKAIVLLRREVKMVGGNVKAITLDENACNGLVMQLAEHNFYIEEQIVPAKMESLKTGKPIKYDLPTMLWGIKIIQETPLYYVDYLL